MVAGHKRMWTSTNYFLVNLSFTDLLMTILNGLFNFIYMRDNDWPFGSAYCTVNNFVAYYTVIASVLTLTAITLDRYEKCINFLTLLFTFEVYIQQGQSIILAFLIRITYVEIFNSMETIYFISGPFNILILDRFVAQKNV